MSKSFLPIGSVVLLKGGNKRVMICGRIQTKSGEDRIYDYSACFFPEGIVDPKRMFFFDHDAIARVFFIGLQDEEELEYENALNNLGELKIENGQIVPVDVENDRSDTSQE